MNKDTVETISLIVTIIGLTITVSLSTWQHKDNTQFQINKELSATAQKIRSIRSESDYGKIELKADLGSEYYSLLVYADELITRADKPGVADCIIIAKETRNNGNYERALEIFKTAVSNAKDNNYDKIQVLRELGYHYAYMAKKYKSRKDQYIKLCEETYDKAIAVWDYQDNPDYHKKTTDKSIKYKNDTLVSCK